MRTTDRQESGLRVPLALIGAFFGLLQGGVAGGAMGLVGGWLVGSFASSLGTGVLILSFAFGILWFQGRSSGDAEAPGATAGPGSSPVDPGSEVGVRLERVVHRWLPETVEAPAEGSFVCLANATDGPVPFEMRFGEGAWTAVALGPGMRGFAGPGDAARFEARWHSRPGASASTRWTTGTPAAAPLDAAACARVRRLEFVREDGRTYLVNPTAGPRSLVCLANRSGASVEVEYAWGDAEMARVVIAPRRNRWFESEPGREFRVRYPVVPGREVQEVALVPREAREPFTCAKGSRHVFQESEGRIELRPDPA